MADTSFLRLHPNKEVAQDLGESPNATLRITPQIQFIPYDPKPYVQVTSSDTPLSFGENYIVYLVNSRTGEEIDITEHVTLSSEVENQIKIQIVYLRFDMNFDPCYLKIDRYGNALKYYYSNKFIVTYNESHLTSRIDYVDKSVYYLNPKGQRVTFLQSIRLQFYFKDYISATEVDSYYQITTSQTVNPRISLKEYSEWATQLFNAWTFKRLSRALYTGKCYINQVRNYPIEGVEYQPREGNSNISQNVFTTDQDDTDTITIKEIIIDPDYETIPFLASSSQLASSSFLTSSSTISIPIP